MRLFLSGLSYLDADGKQQKVISPELGLCQPGAIERQRVKRVWDIGGGISYNERTWDVSRLREGTAEEGDRRQERRGTEGTSGPKIP